MQRKFFPIAMFSMLSLAGCGRDAPEQAAPADETVAQPTPAESAPPAVAAPTATSTVSVDDIDRWKQGMEAELKAVQEAAAKLAEAKDENAKLEALTAAMEMNTIDAAAKGAGLDRDRYRRIRNTFSDAVAQLSPIEMEMDVAKMPPQMVEQMKEARTASATQLSTQLPADVFEALKSRAAELRQQDKLIVAERLKVASAAR